MAGLIGVDEQKLARIESNPEEEASLTITQLRDIAVFLNVDITYLMLGAVSARDERMRRSHDNLKVVAREEDMEYRDFESLYDGYCQSARQKIGFVASTKNTRIVSKEQWRAWYQQMIAKRGGLELQF